MWITAFLITCLLVLISHFIQRKWKTLIENQPPGPLGLPILGYSFFLKPRTFKAFMALKEKYPHIAQVDFGTHSMILLTSYQAIKEALILKGKNFSGRQRNTLSKVIGIGSGIIGSEGAFWEEHRRFSLRTLRDFGLGRNEAERIIQQEIEFLTSHIEKLITQDGGEINTIDLFLRSVSNVICTLTMGERPGYEDDEFSGVMQSVRENLGVTAFTSPAMMFPGLFKYFQSAMLLIPRTRRILRNLRHTLAYLETKISSHMKNFHANEESVDYIDAFLQEKHRLDAIDSSSHTYTTGQLKREIFELFIAGTDTTSNSLCWSLILLAIHPDIQKRCHDEIDAAIGREKMATMKNKEQMPFIQAVLDEVQRYGSIVPMGVLHRNFEEDTVRGYRIPQSTLIVPFVYGAHHDP
jgi:cytochrome P450 family 2 subfamily J